MAKSSPDKGIVFNIQRYSIQDGPGIRSTVFLKGCPLRCQWCSNPESQNAFPEVAHRDTLCDKCGACVSLCRPKAISIDKDGVYIDRKLCDNCGQCVDACAPGALTVYGKEMTVVEVFEEVKKDIQYYHNSGGGVTASGGEPLDQADFVAALFNLCREAGLHTTLDTSGCADPAALGTVLPYTSLVLFDVKLSSAAAHKKWTGLSNDRIISNLRLLGAKGTPALVRVPFIPGVNDSAEELKSIALLAASCLKEPKINLLPYHRFGTGKYKQLDRKYRLDSLIRQSDTEIQRAKEIIESNGIACDIVL